MLGKYQTYPSLDISIIFSVLTVSVVLHQRKNKRLITITNLIHINMAIFHFSFKVMLQH